MCPVILAQDPHVTETKLVNAEDRKGKELLRKINGRWWSQDNREVTPPAKGGFFWVLDSKPGVCQFFHHHPFQLDLAESLHLWMRKQEVEAALGPPNRTFGTGDRAWWYYYASNGTKLDIWFLEDGVLADAKYDATGEKSWQVASIERELNGRSIFTLLSERAGRRSQERQPARSETVRTGVRSRIAQPRTVTVQSMDAPAAAQPDHPAEKRIVSVEALASVTAGSTRQEVLGRLGEPTYRSAITSDEGTRETFTYHLASGEPAVISLVDGKVIKVR
jgi:outer membrane protein assembly factor BamE (lipoprotein component of BamABCDE complex)